MRILYLAKLCLKTEIEIKVCPDKQKLKELIITTYVVQEMLKGVLQVEMKRPSTVKISSKGKYIDKYKNQYYCNFGL